MVAIPHCNRRPNTSILSTVGILRAIRNLRGHLLHRFFNRQFQINRPLRGRRRVPRVRPMGYVRIRKLNPQVRTRLLLNTMSSNTVRTMNQSQLTFPVVRHFINASSNRRLNIKGNSNLKEYHTPRRPNRYNIRIQRAVTRNLRHRNQTTPTRKLIRHRPSTLTLRFRSTRINEIFFPIMNPRPNFLSNDKDLNTMRPRNRYRDTRRNRRNHRGNRRLLFPRNNVSLFRQNINLHVNLRQS